MINHIKKAWQSLYQQFISINDSPQHIALGFGLGFFLGILPFTGVFAAIGVAWFLRLNKAAAILGSLLSNTWLSFVVLAISVKGTGFFLGMRHEDIWLKFQNLIKDFHWANLTDALVLKIMAAVAVGYFIVSIFLSIIAYLICLAVIYWKRGSR